MEGVDNAATIHWPSRCFFQRERKHSMNYKYADLGGLKVFYREAGDPKNPTMVLLHGFPSSSHMYRNLMEKLGGQVLPDRAGLSRASAIPTLRRPTSSPTPSTTIRGCRELLVSLSIKKFTMFIQDYGSPVGFRIAVRHPDWIEGIISQNGNAYEEGFTGVWDALRTALWKNRTPETEAPLAGFFTPDGVKWIYSEGTRDPEKLSPDNWNTDLFFLGRPRITVSSSTCSTTIGPTSSSIHMARVSPQEPAAHAPGVGCKRSDLHSGRRSRVPARCEECRAPHARHGALRPGRPLR
jgi:Predicted hydrolases or acyltransferases (alpha/beta hydrolase superfamily)